MYAQRHYHWSPFVRHDHLRRACDRPAEGARRSRGGGLIETVATGCEKELAAYCQGVTPGEGRILACLYAHEDKLSGQCEYALFDAAAQLERAVAALAYLVNECGDDLETYCVGVQAGEGRLLDCLIRTKRKSAAGASRH
jgi:hypothetical protein